MLITVSNKVLRERFGEKKSLEIIKNAGFDGVDYSFDKFDLKSNVLGEDYIKNAKQTRKILDDLHLVCYQAHAPFKLKYGDNFSCLSSDYLEIVRSLEYSSILGCKYIVVHAINCPNDIDIIQYNIDYYNSLLPYAKKYGVIICIENLYKTLNTIESHKAVYSALDKNYFSICIDVGHSVRCGYMPYDYINSFEKNQITCVHIQDMDGVNDNHWIPYQGVIDWNKTLKALKEYGFCGTLNFELIHCFDHIENELMFDTMVYAEKVGRFMLKKFQTL